ncbi:MAG: hypothetical protein H6651_12815 [Ardenticatenales bacterium]|nr:hypothetical protein [Ardenticatenales bacterium]
MTRRYRKSIVQAAIQQLDKVRELWLNRPGVTGLDVGYRLEDGHLTDELAIRVHVARKLPNSALEPGTSFSIQGDSSLLGDFRIDVIEASYKPAAAAPPGANIVRTNRIDPIVGGISVGNARVSAGTLGAIVWDRESGAPCVISNWHVLCGSNACKPGEIIYQPGPFDGGGQEDRIAELLRWQLDRHGDAALAKLSGDREFARDLLALNPLAGIEADPRLGLKVVKSGRTTGVTEGSLTASVFRWGFKYENGPFVMFHNQLRIVPRAPWPAVNYELSGGGDSGAIWVNESNNRAVGLHFAGEQDGRPIAEYAAANRLDVLADQLNFDVQPIFADQPRPPAEQPAPEPAGETPPPASEPTPVPSRRRAPVITTAPPPPRPDAGAQLDLWRMALRRVLCQIFPALCDPDRAQSLADQLDLNAIDLEAVVEAIIKELKD